MSREIFKNGFLRDLSFYNTSRRECTRCFLHSTIYRGGASHNSTPCMPSVWKVSCVCRPTVNVLNTEIAALPAALACSDLTQPITTRKAWCNGSGFSFAWYSVHLVYAHGEVRPPRGALSAAGFSFEPSSRSPLSILYLYIHVVFRVVHRSVLSGPCCAFFYSLAP